MASPLKYGFSVPALNDAVFSKPKDAFGFSQSVGGNGMPLISSDREDFRDRSIKSPTNFSIRAQSSISVSRAMRWWEKTLKPNMVEIHSAQQLVESLRNAGDQLVVVDFYSPGCGGCKALHPKICQLAEQHPDAIFLKVNYEELKTTCHALNIHVLPFFRFYRGAEGRLCSFSCTNATIKKFKDALAKYGSDRCWSGPAKGLEESEILKLGSVGELPNNMVVASKSNNREQIIEAYLMKNIELGEHRVDYREDSFVGV